MRLVVIGFGVVGQSFAKLLLSRSADLYRQYGVNPRIVACVDNGGYAVSATGIDLQRLLNTKKLSGTVGAYDKESRKFDPIRLIEKVDAEILLELTPTNLDNGEPGMSNIIAAMKSGKHVIRRGIRGVSLLDVQRANKKRNAIKLIAMCDNKQLDVKPTELSNVDPICVNGTLNAVTFSSEHSGEHTIIGHGAGGIPTA